VDHGPAAEADPDAVPVPVGLGRRNDDLPETERVLTVGEAVDRTPVGVQRLLAGVLRGLGLLIIQRLRGLRTRWIRF